MVVRRVLGVLVIGTLLGACGGGGGGGGGTGGGGTQPSVVLQRIDITGLPASWTVGQTVNLTATAVFSNGTTQNITATATWTSSNSAVAIVSGGVVTVLTSGSTTVRAASQGVTSADVNVQVASVPTTRFTLSGTIRQGSVTPIVGATVLIVDGANANTSATTDSTGLYRLLSLLPGTFKIRATATGFDTTERNVTIISADVRDDFQMTPSSTGPRANPGGPYTAIHDFDVVFDGLASTVTGATIDKYEWNCGQSVQLGCDKTGPRPTFNYRKCGVPGRPACRAGSTTVADYTVTLTVTDSLGRRHTATTTITVTNRY